VRTEPGVTVQCLSCGRVGVLTREALAGLAIAPGTPIAASKTVADLRALNAWSPNWALIVPYERQRPESVVEVELA
jgi:hypothetical protein